MPGNRQIIKIIIGGLVLLLSASHVAAAGLSTLFTTSEEREIINSNRYRSNDGKAKPVVVEDIVTAPVPVMNQTEITREYKISGITISSDGPHTVWINSTAYEDGEELEDKSRIKVMVGDEIRVRITAPDGKNYYSTSGETLEVTYFANLGN
jgi:hypothetical protein